MAEEVDQTSIDVIKTLLESENGKAFFYDYLNKNLQLTISGYTNKITVSILFNNLYVSGGQITINNPF